MPFQFKKILFIFKITLVLLLVSLVVVRPYFFVNFIVTKVRPLFIKDNQREVELEDKNPFKSIDIGEVNLGFDLIPRYPNLSNYCGFEKSKLGKDIDDVNCFKENHYTSIDDNVGLADFQKFMEKIFDQNNLEYKWNNWRYEDYYLYFSISEFDQEKRTVQSAILIPEQNKDLEHVKRNIYCPKESTSIISIKDMSPIKRWVEFYEEFNPETDFLYSYCYDKECNFIGSSCIIVRDLSKINPINPINDINEINEINDGSMNDKN